MFDIKVVRESIPRAEVKKMAEEGFGDMVKAVVDVEQEIIGLGPELHVDAEAVLIGEEGCTRENTWGINLYPFKTGDEFIEFDSMVNIKPALGNRSRGIENSEVKEKIINVVKKLLK